MIIELSPILGNKEMLLDVEGDKVYINGEEFDFTELPEGATLPSGAIDSDYFEGEVTRINGRLKMCIVMPHGDNAPIETCYPQPIHVLEDGSVTLPPFNMTFDDVVEPIEEVVDED